MKVNVKDSAIGEITVGLCGSMIEITLTDKFGNVFHTHNVDKVIAETVRATAVHRGKLYIAYKTIDVIMDKIIIFAIEKYDIYQIEELSNKPGFTIIGFSEEPPNEAGEYSTLMIICKYTDDKLSIVEV